MNTKEMEMVITATQEKLTKINQEIEELTEAKKRHEGVLAAYKKYMKRSEKIDMEVERKRRVLEEEMRKDLQGEPYVKESDKITNGSDY